MSTIKSSTLQAMLDDVANDFIDALKTKQEALAKSELRKDFPPAKEDSEAPAEEGSESKPDASASPAPDESAAPEAAPAPDAAAPAPGAEAAPADPAMGDPAAEQQLDPAALQAEYAKLPPDQLEMHLQAAMAAKQALAGSPADPGLDAGAPPPAAPAPEMKSEASAGEKSKEESKELEKSVIAKSEELAKALAEIEELKKLHKSQAEELTALQAGVQKFVDVPARKAITTVNHVTREVTATASKEWTKEGIHNHLKKLSATPSLKKSDRDLINDFYCKVVSIDKLAHLFEENK